MLPEAPAEARRPRNVLPRLLAGVAGLACALGLVWWLASGTGEAPAGPAETAREVSAEPVKITPFTADGGFKNSPRFSPDGEKVAYMWNGAAHDNWDIYVKALGLGTRPLRLTDAPAFEAWPAWSPDGRQIAFVRFWADAGGAVYTVPSLGGQERKLVDIDGLFWTEFGLPIPVLSWSPDGDWLYLAEQKATDAPPRLVRLSMKTLEKKPLAFSPGDAFGDLGPALSPDGTQLAFVRPASRSLGGDDVWVHSFADGKTRRLTHGGYDFCWGLAWTAEGREIVFSVQAGDSERLLRVGLAGGEPRPLVGVGEDAVSATIRGDRAVYVQTTVLPGDIWRAPGRTAPHAARTAEKLIASSRNDQNPAYSPDGTRIAFESARAGYTNIWASGSDGSDPVQLTSFESHAGTPRWSPDGRRLAFDSNRGGDWNIYVIDADGGVPRQLTREPSSETRPAWSPDGRWVYFGSDRSGRSEIWRIPSAGGEATQVTRNGGMAPTVSKDGRHVYYSKVRLASGVWRVPVDGGEETQDVAEPVNAEDWDLARGGIYYAQDSGDTYTIECLDLDSGKVTEVFRKEGPFGQWWLSVSPDEEWVLFAESPDGQSELMLMENFH